MTNAHEPGYVCNVAGISLGGDGKVSVVEYANESTPV